MSKHSEFFSTLSEDHQVSILEAARRGLQDENMLDEMDLAGASAFEIVEGLDKYLGVTHEVLPPV